MTEFNATDTLILSPVLHLNTLIQKHYWHQGPQKTATSKKLLIGFWDCVWVCLRVCLRHKVLLHCSFYTISCSQPWRSLVFNGASAHWSGRQSSVLFAVWYMETSLCLESPAAVKTLSWSCYAMWKTEGGGCCSFKKDFTVFLLLRCLIVALTAGLV